MDRLRQNGSVLLSLVAVVDGRVAGHILYTPVSVGDRQVHAAGLAPMAVHPEFQKAGIGSMLVAEGTNRLRAAGCPLIVVLGHPGYYPRFGFVPASRCRLQCEWDVPDDVFMALPLDVSRVRNMTGIVRYSSEFSTATAG